MRTKVNAKRLGYLVAATVLVGSGMHLLHAYQVKRNAGALLKQANRAEEQGNLDQTIEYLDRYLTLAPRDTEALARYGLKLEQQAKSYDGHTHALLVLEQVLRREPGRAAIRRKLVSIAMELGRFADARDHLQTLLKASPDDGALEQLLGQCEEGNKEYARAAAWYEKAIQHAPHQIESSVRLAGLVRRRLNQPDRADRVMDAMVARNKGSFRAYLARARYDQEKAGSLNRAADDMARALQLAPRDADVLMGAAELAATRGQLDGARKSLARGLELHPKDVRMYEAMADVERRANRAAAAVDCLKRGLKALEGSPQEPELRFSLAGAMIEAGQLDAAGREIERVRQGGVPTAPLDLLQARILVGRGRWLEAAKSLEGLRTRLVVPELTMQADLLLGQCYERMGDPDRQYTAYRQAVDLMETPNDPNWVVGHLGLGSALAALDKIDEAVEAYRAVIPQAPQVRTTVARLLVRRALELPPDQRSWDGVDQALNDAARAAPGSVEVPLLKAQSLVARGRLAEARTVLETARKEHPKQVEPWIGLADLAGRQDQAPKAALAVLDEAQRRLGDRVELRLERAGYWAQRPAAEARKPLARLAEDTATFSAADRQRLLRGLAGAEARIGATAEAARLWGSLAEQQPRDLGVRLALFDQALKAGNQAGMNHQIAAIRSIEGEDGTLWRYGQACNLVWQAKNQSGDKKPLLDQARSDLAAVAARRPAWSRVAVCEAEIDELAGSPDSAVKDYLRAIDLGDRSPVVFHRAIQLLYESRRFADADRVIRQLQEQTPDLGDLQRLAVDVALRTQDYSRALELARKAVRPDSKDARDHLWLGQVLWAIPDQRLNAEPELRRAVALAGTDPAPRVALVQYLARSGRKTAAEAAIADAQRALHGDQARLALAQCYEAVGRRDRAAELYAAALAAQPDDVPTLRTVARFYLRTGKFKDAEPALGKIIDFQIKAPGDAAWARRMLPVIKALGGDYQQSSQALELLGVLKGDAADRWPSGEAMTEDDLRAKAMVLATRKDHHDRRRAIDILEQLGRRQPLPPEDQFLLAQLYETVHDWPRARDRMLSLLASNGDNPLYLAYYARVLIRRHEAGEAEIWVAKLENREPGSFRTLDLRARLLQEQGQGERAVELLRAYAQAHADANLLPVAALLEELGQPAAAEQMYREAVSQSKRPETVLVLAQFLGRQGRVREALDLCEQAGRSCAPEAVGIASLNVLHAAGANAADYRRVDQWLGRAIQKAPSPTLAVCLADLRNLQGRYAEAEALYRQVVGQNDRNAVALNNLACLLAYQGGQGDDAVSLIEQAIQVLGPIPELLDSQGVAHLAQGKSELAISDLEEAVADSPAESKLLPILYFHLARAYQAAGNRGKAASALRKAHDSGLDVNQIHPLERPIHQQLLSELGFKGIPAHSDRSS